MMVSTMYHTLIIINMCLNVSHVTIYQVSNNGIEISMTCLIIKVRYT